jgi:hypothetical protein
MVWMSIREAVLDVFGSASDLQMKRNRDVGGHNPRRLRQRYSQNIANDECQTFFYTQFWFIHQTRYPEYSE